MASIYQIPTKYRECEACGLPTTQIFCFECDQQHRALLAREGELAQGPIVAIGAAIWADLTDLFIDFLLFIGKRFR